MIYQATLFRIRPHTFLSTYCSLILAFGLVLVDLVLYATFNNISAISWRSVLLLEETAQCTRRKH